jgi:hypothetical protein
MVLQCATIIDHAGLTVGEYVANAQFVLLQDRTYRRHQCCQFKRNGDFGRSQFFWAAFRQTLLVLNKYGYANFEHNRDSAQFDLFFRLPFSVIGGRGAI